MLEQCAGKGLLLALHQQGVTRLAVFARRSLKREPPLPAPPESGTDPDWAVRYLHEYRAITGTQADTDTTLKALRGGMEDDNFSQRKSKLDKRLKNALGAAAESYSIKDGSTRPGRYSLTLCVDVVRFITDVASKEKIK